jgi:methionine synthase I (cobalamin-dependent)
MSPKLPFIDLLKQRTVLFDGAMGTSLIIRGLAAGESVESWNISRGEEISRIHQAYVQAGADVIQTNTLGGTRIKLMACGLEDQLVEVNAQAVRLARAACPAEGYVAGDIGPTGKFLPPVGTCTPGEMEKTFREQAEVLAGEGVDLFIVETMYDLQEILAAVRAVRSFSDLPIVATVTFERKPRGFFTIMGNSVADCARELTEAGADVLGSNCGMGSGEAVDLAPLWRMATGLPVLIQPNRGQPEMKDGRLIYQQRPEAFAEDIVSIVKAGIDAVGGCCGTTPEFIKLIHTRLLEEGFMHEER